MDNLLSGGAPFYKFDSKIRIPISGSIPLTKGIRKIIDTQEFQRLRGVRQLGPTMFVFPGATHTRFEHSLGTYWLSIRYLRQVVNLEHFDLLIKNKDEAIKLVVLSALLHDLGHYPYSHWIEELKLQDVFPSHEERAGEIIKKGEIGKIISEHWDVPPKDVANIIYNSKTPKRHYFLNSIIDSVLDVDKLDYLTRDSIHCGVDYGKGIDINRLIDALYINCEGYVSITNKGQSVLMALLAIRNIMYQEVYWHKTVRACQAMFKRYFYEFYNSGIKDDDEIIEATYFSDEAFLDFLFQPFKNDKSLNQLINPFVLKGRQLYKPALVYSRQMHLGRKVDAFFADLLNNPSYETLVNKSNELSKILDIPEFEILIETVPVKANEKYKLDKFQIFNHKSKNLNNEGWRDPSDSLKTLNNYLEENQRAFIFCKADHYSRLRDFRVDDWEQVFFQVG